VAVEVAAVAVAVVASMGFEVAILKRCIDALLDNGSLLYLPLPSITLPPLHLLTLLLVFICTTM
jgi:hypothetical protein